ncbi:hypothetical protein L7F22_028436 [Adiantum nelumboides]|nr:hypothetical protein [Adiantum nelumboides]
MAAFSAVEPLRAVFFSQSSTIRSTFFSSLKSVFFSQSNPIRSTFSTARAALRSAACVFLIASGQAAPSQAGSSFNGFRNRERPRQDRRRDDRRNLQQDATTGQHTSSSAPSTSQSSRQGLCTICNGNHRWYECPKRPNPSNTRRNTNMESCPETEQCSTSNTDKGKQVVRAVRVSKVVSALMLNANTNISVPVNLSNQVLSLLGFVGKHPLNVLVDSGLSTNFVSTMLVSKLRLPTQQSLEAFQVELADDSYLQYTKKVQQLEFQIQDYQDQLGFSVMPLSHYDMILGQSWLYQNDPIISFRDHSIRLFHKNQEVEVRGLFNTQPITMVSAMQVKRLVRKRDYTTALVMLREEEDDTEIIKKNSVVSYKLELPPSWGKLHPTFHISWLKQCIQGDSSVPELSSYVPEIEDKHVILVPELILDVRQKETRRKLTTEFLVKWMDLDESDSTWQTDEEMQQYPSLLQEFFDKTADFYLTHGFYFKMGGNVTIVT